MKTRLLPTELEISKSFERELSQFLADRCGAINDNIAYLAIDVNESPDVLLHQIGDEVHMTLEEVALRFNFDPAAIYVSVFWSHKSGSFPVYPDNTIRPDDLVFGVEELEEQADWMRNRFKSKPDPDPNQALLFADKAE
jgi:hypothetical protein